MSTRENGSILLADDDSLFLRITRDFLRRRGYEVECVRDGPGVLAAIERGAFDLLVVDIMMPGNEELQLLAKRERDWPPIIVVTAGPTVDTAVQALRGPARDYLIKPLAYDDFARRVELVIAQGRQLRDVRQARHEVSRCLQRVLELEAALERSVAAPAAQPTRDPLGCLEGHHVDVLTPRERDVLRQFAEFPRVKEVSARLRISPHTVRSHLKSLYRKLGVSSQLELLRLLTGEPAQPA